MPPATPSLRLLLDQNFPTPIFGLEELDESVRFVPLSRFAPQLSEANTPDWLIYLAAAHGGLDGVVTRDLSQISDPKCLVALSHTDLCIITWAHPIEDAVTEWAQLMAYLPEIKKRLAEDRHRIILLPAPRLRSRQSFLKASDLLHKQAGDARRSYGELRQECLVEMRVVLRKRKRFDLLPIVAGPTPTKSTPPWQRAKT